MPGSTEAPTGTEPDQPDIAPPWHTATLIALIVGVAAIGFLLTSRGIAVQLPVASTSRNIVYLQMILVTWGLFFYVCRIGRRRNALPALLGTTWSSFGRAGTDLALAASVWLLLKTCEWAALNWFATGASASVAALLPRTPFECAAWVIVSVSVGLSEEVVFRGYLQTQLAALTGRASVGLILQAMLFGLAHGEQGLSAMLRLAGYGLVFGALARFRRSLLPGIVCHVWTNLASGLLHF